MRGLGQMQKQGQISLGLGLLDQVIMKRKIELNISSLRKGVKEIEFRGEGIQLPES